VTEFGGLATTALADRVVCLTLASDECLDGTRAVLDALRGAERPPGRGAVTVDVLLHRVGEASQEQTRRLAEHVGVSKLAAVLHHDVEGVEKWPPIGAEWIAQSF
jgi:hypothetical protein